MTGIPEKLSWPGCPQGQSFAAKMGTELADVRGLKRETSTPSLCPTLRVVAFTPRTRSMPEVPFEPTAVEASGTKGATSVDVETEVDVTVKVEVDVTVD
jgi:hypothetical protein